MISIIIPLYNKAPYVAQTLQTVLNQTFKDFEIVIVNDGSTDGSVAEVEKFTDSRIRMIHQTNAGVSAARNRGIEEAKGEYIAFLDADDEWDARYLEVQDGLMRRYPECDVFVSNYCFKETGGSVNPTIIRKLHISGKDGVMDNYFEVASCSHPPMWTSAVCATKKALQAVGGFPVGIKSGEDLLTWARLAFRYKIAYAKGVYATFNIVGGKMSERPKRIPAEEDVVGAELVKLYKSHPDISGLRKYVGLWFKMRSAIYMRLGMRRKSIKEAFKSLRYNPLNYKIYLYIAYNLVPHK